MVVAKKDIKVAIKQNGKNTEHMDGFKFLNVMIQKDKISNRLDNTTKFPESLFKLKLTYGCES